MRKIYCDLCGARIGEVSKDGVEILRDKLSVKIGKKDFPEICSVCYGNVLEFIEGIKRQK